MLSSRSISNLFSVALNLSSDCRLVLVRDDYQLSWYDPGFVDAIERVIQTNFCLVRTIPIEDPLSIDLSELEFIEVDVVVFLSRVGDVQRFSTEAPYRSIVLYARTAEQFNSLFCEFPYDTLADLERRTEAAILASQNLTLTCPIGSNLRFGRSFFENSEDEVLQKQLKFPNGIHRPMVSPDLSGKIVSEVPPIVSSQLEATPPRQFPNKQFHFAIENQIMKLVSDSGKEKIKGPKYQVLSWHRGLHPHCEADRRKYQSIDKWADTAFLAVNILHFHLKCKATDRLGSLTIQFNELILE